MARRKARKAGGKMQPAVKTLNFAVTGGTVQTIDLSQCASLVNRRFYRAGLNWAVAGFTFIQIDTNQTGIIGIQKIPDTYVASNSWHKGFAHWNELNNRALDATESTKAKFTDFKVYMDEIHHSDGSVANLTPTAYQLGEWEYSKMALPDSSDPGTSNEYDIMWVGGNYPGVSAATGYNAVSLIDGYSASRALPNIADPNTPTDNRIVDGEFPENWLSAIDNEGTSQIDSVLNDLNLENDQAPYPYENDGVHTDTMYPGGPNQPDLSLVSGATPLETHDITAFTATTISGISRMNGTNFQGGLIRLDASGLSNDSIFNLFVHLVPGDHRGYLCQPMQDV